MALPIYTMKQGASGSAMTAILSDDNGAINLTGFASITITVQNGLSDPVIDEAACTVTDAANGVIEFEFDAITSAIEPGEYDVEFTATDAGGEVFKFPTHKRYPYAKLIVLRSLGGTV